MNLFQTACFDRVSIQSSFFFFLFFEMKKLAFRQLLSHRNLAAG